MDGMLQRLLEELEPQPKKGATTRPKPSSLELFGKQDITVDGTRFSLEGREPVREIIELIDRVIRTGQAGVQVAVIGAEQWGKTASVLLTPALHLVVDHARNVGYFLPTDKFARKFGRTRLKNLIKASPFLRESLRDKEVVNQATLKEFSGHFFYLLGLQEMLDAISIPLDALFFDEVDLLPTENQEWSEGRVAASDLRLKVFAAAGYVPGGGIDSRWQEGTQHRYLFDCPKRSCGTRRICLEENFPDCMVMVDEEWRRCCPRCKTPLDLKRGTWVATYPERAKLKKYSYRVSSLIIEARDAEHIMEGWEKAKRRKSRKAKFSCAELAIPDAGAMQPVTEAELARMRERYLMKRERSGRPRYAGVDMGDNIHVWVDERDETGRPVLVWADELDSDTAESELCELIEQLGIVQMVIDKKPLTTLARAVAYRFPNIVALIDFVENSTLEVVEEEHQKKTYRCVKVDRNESLDEFTEEITDERRPLKIPDAEYTNARQTEVLALVATHLKNLRKQRSVTANGRTVDRYVHKTANHLGMGGNYALLAERIAPVHVKFPPVVRKTRSRVEKLSSALGVGRGDRDDQAGARRRGGRGRSLRRIL